MWKKVLISGAVGAAILGAGGTALAATGSSSPSPTPSTTSSTPATHSGHTKAKHRIAATMRRTVQATWVTGKDGHFVTHDAIRGTATVGTSSITVKAADGTSETFAVTSKTKVRDKGDLKKVVPFSTVHNDDVVGVLGTGSGSSLTATQIVDAGPPSTTS